MKSLIKSVYIHIPFCKNICSYCDFAKIYYNQKIVDKYLVSLKNEIIENYQNEAIETIYIGGGTPSCLSISELEEVFDIINIFDKSCLKEFTIEVNPDDITVEKLDLFKKNGINRISIGHQTSNTAYLKTLNRKFFVTKDMIDLAKQFFSNISIDLMYGFKNQNEEEFIKDIDYVLSLGVRHISTYSLIVEEHTKLFVDKYRRLDDESDANFYNIIRKKLKEAGYKQYEISNFAKEGYESRHNLVYWNNLEYYGFGMGASGYVDNVRYSNTRSITSYINNKNIRDMAYLSKDDMMVYEMILGLRKVEGVSKDVFFDKYSCTIEQAFDIMKLIDNNLLDDNGIYLKIPEKYLYLENKILINFLEVHNEK